MTTEIDCPEGCLGNVEWWRSAIAQQGSLWRLRPEHKVRAAQEPGIKAERKVYNALMQHLSEFIARKVRAQAVLRAAVASLTRAFRFGAMRSVKRGLNFDPWTG